jgi:hypothetical protein
MQYIFPIHIGKALIELNERYLESNSSKQIMVLGKKLHNLIFYLTYWLRVSENRVSGLYTIEKWRFLHQKWQKTVYKIYRFYWMLRQLHPNCTQNRKGNSFLWIPEFWGWFLATWGNPLLIKTSIHSQTQQSVCFNILYLRFPAWMIVITEAGCRGKTWINKRVNNDTVIGSFKRCEHNEFSVKRKRWREGRVRSPS